MYWVCMILLLALGLQGKDWLMPEAVLAAPEGACLGGMFRTRAPLHIRMALISEAALQQGVRSRNTPSRQEASGQRELFTGESSLMGQFKSHEQQTKRGQL